MTLLHRATTSQFYYPHFCKVHFNITVPDNLTEVLTVDDKHFNLYTNDSKYIGMHRVNVTIVNEHAGEEIKKF